MSRLFMICMDIEGNDRGATVTIVAADSILEAKEKAVAHVGVMNQNFRNRNIRIIGSKEIGANGCYVSDHIPRDWLIN